MTKPAFSGFLVARSGVAAVEFALINADNFSGWVSI
jgi:Flp pilus assembly protein TadG